MVYKSIKIKLLQKLINPENKSNKSISWNQINKFYKMTVAKKILKKGNIQRRNNKIKVINKPNPESDSLPLILGQINDVAIKIQQILKNNSKAVVGNILTKEFGTADSINLFIIPGEDGFKCVINFNEEGESSVGTPDIVPPINFNGYKIDIQIDYVLIQRNILNVTINLEPIEQGMPIPIQSAAVGKDSIKKPKTISITAIKINL